MPAFLLRRFLSSLVVLFCVVFYIASSLQTFVYMATRLAFGPGTDLRQYAMSPFDDWHALAWAGALVLTLFVLVLSLTSRLILLRNRSH